MADDRGRKAEDSGLRASDDQIQMKNNDGGANP